MVAVKVRHIVTTLPTDTTHTNWPCSHSRAACWQTVCKYLACRSGVLELNCLTQLNASANIVLKLQDDISSVNWRGSQLERGTPGHDRPPPYVGGGYAMHTPRIATCLLAAGALLTEIGTAVAQNFPNKPIRMIVAWGPGGAPDIFARVIGNKLFEQMGQPIIVDNRPGATGNIGAEIVARSPNDGYTIFNATLSLAISPAFYRGLAFDPVRSFEPITMLAAVPLVLVVHPDLPVKSVKDLVRHAKSNPGKFNYATVGVGSPAHVSAELLQNLSGIKIVHVPYKSGGAMATAILTREAQLGFPAIAPALPHIKANRLRAVAVTAPKRSNTIPNIPTFAEGGLSGMEVDNWNAILAPAKTPKSVINRLQAEINKAARAPEVAEQFARQGAEVNLNSPSELATVIKAEVAKWAKVVKAAGIEPK